MARLVYNPVTAPNWNVSGTLALANNVLNQASQNFSRALKDFQQTDQNNADRILRERMLGLKTEDEFYNALSSGSLLEGIGNRISSEAAKQIWQDRNDLLTQDKTRLQYKIDSALANSSDIQSAIELAASTGDRQAYQKIISSDRFKALPGQVQQKLIRDFDAIALNRSQLSLNESQLDENKFNQGIKKALAGASNLQSAIELAVTNGDRESYNRIIASDEFKSLPVQAQQELIKGVDFDLGEFRRSQTSSSRRTNRINSETAILKEMFSKEESFFPQGDISTSQTNYDSVVKFADKHGFLPESVQEFRKSAPTLTSTGFNPTTAKGTFDVRALNVDPTEEELSSIGKIFIKNKDNPYKGIWVNAANLVTDRMQRSQIIQQDLKEKFQLPEFAFKNYYDFKEKPIPELIKKVNSAYEMKSEDLQDFSSDLVNTQRKFNLSLKDLNLGVAMYGKDFPEKVKEFESLRKQRGFNEALKFYQSESKAIEKLQKASENYEEATNNLRSAIFNARKEKSVDSYRKYESARESYDFSAKKLLALTSSMDKDSKEQEKNLTDSIKKATPINPIDEAYLRLSEERLNEMLKEYNSLSR